MKKELIKLANHLDRIGLVKEANYIDIIIKSATLDKEEEGLLNRLKNLFMERDPVENEEDNVNTNVPFDIKLNMWKYRSEQGSWPKTENGEDPTEEDFEAMAIEFWEVEPGDYGYEDSFEQGWIDEAGRVYYGEQ